MSSLKGFVLQYEIKKHNLTIFSLAPEHQCSNYWWNKTEGEIEASVFASIIIKHITKYCIKDSTNQRENDKNNIILYSDGCGYQNRNIILSNTMLNFSINNNIVIEQKYLVKGHTQMACVTIIKKYRNLFTIRLC